MTEIPLDLIRTFVLVAKHQSFARAATDLRVTPSAVSRQVKMLERTLGSQLFLRTTRTMSLTQGGAAYYAAAKEAFDRLEAAGQSLESLQGELSGPLRVSSPVSLGRRYVVPALSDFLQRYPGLSLDLVMTDRYVDLVKEGFDVAVRVGRLESSTLRARKLLDNHRVLVASRGYLDRHGCPRTVDELARHRCLALAINRDGEQWRLFRNGEPEASFKPAGGLRANNGDAVRQFAEAGHGIAFLSLGLVADALRGGRLVQVLPEYAGASAGIHAVFLEGPVIRPKVRALVDFLVEAFANSNQSVRVDGSLRAGR